MAGILNAAAQRLNASVAGATGALALPVNEPGARYATSPTELTYVIPTEFGDLTALFGGEPTTAPTNTQFAPVNTGPVVPGGSVAGRLGGLVPDFRNTTNNAVETARAAVEGPTLTPMSVGIKNVWQKALHWARPLFPGQPPNYP